MDANDMQDLETTTCDVTTSLFHPVYSSDYHLNLYQLRSCRAKSQRSQEWRKTTH